MDVEPKYSEGHGFADIFIENRIKFPQTWDSVPMKEERQYFNVIVKVSKEGLLENWKINLYNLKKSNASHYDNIKQQIDSILNQMMYWEPGQLGPNNVASYYWIDVGLDKRTY